MQASRRPARPWLLIIGSAVLAAVLVAAVLVGLPHVLGRCRSGLLTSPSGECVGVVHDRDLLAEDLRGLYDRIDQANTQVESSGAPYVKIVLLTPLHVSPTDAPVAITAPQVKESLEGALTALRVANTESEFGSPAPTRIEMLLADHGSQQEDTPGLADAIVAEGDRDHPVVAVVGLGSSFAGTLATVRKLGAKGVPMVSALASADGFTSRDVPGLRSVSPSNTDYAKALLDFLHARPALRTGIVVADQNPDPFTTSLRQAFTTVLSEYATYPTQSFNGSTIRSAPPGIFEPVVTNICNVVHPGSPASLHLVLYAGRLGDVKSLLQSLENRVCKAEPLVILAVGTGIAAAAEYSDLMARANVSVVYATSADAPRWRAGAPGTPAGFGAFRQRFSDDGFDPASLDDGLAIAYHDAVVTAATAIHLAATRGDVRATGVDTQLNNLNLAYSVPAASGTLSFTQDGNGGRAVGKLVPLRQIGSSPLVTLPADRCVSVVGGSCTPAGNP